MSVETWLLFCVTETVLCFTPGPAVLLTLSLGLTRGRRAGLDGSLGILSANALYFALSATGIAAVLVASWELFFLIKWVGAVYLIGLGLSMLFRRAERPAAADPLRGPPTGTGWRYFGHGFLTQAANPKNLLFFTALLPQFIDPRAPLASQILILGLSSLLIELAVLSLYATLAHRARAVVERADASTGFRRAGGLLLVGAGAGLASLRRS